MSHKIKKITAVVMAVIFLVGVFPLLLTNFWGLGNSSEIEVKVALPGGEIKSLPLEEYLVGVVAAEMPAEFAKEALKAQAVAARTYALKRVEDRVQGTAYDVDTTEKTQAWHSREDLIKKWGFFDYFTYHRKITQAVKETEGRILTYNGEKIDAVYHSSCGRKGTERAGEVWSGDVKYLTNVSSGEENTLRYVDHKVFDSKTFFELLGFTQVPKQIQELDIIIIDRTKAGRIKTLAIRNRIFSGTELRTKLQLPSTDFEWKIQGSGIEFITYGKGHAVGMSQYGANDLAKAGNSYGDILRHFYPGAEIEKLY